MHRLIFLFFPTLLFGQDALNIDLLDNWQEDTLVVNSTNVRYNDCWGYTRNGQEYALAGSTEGIHAFKLTDNNQFVHLDFIEGKYNHSMVVHRDIKTYQNYAYAVCDEGFSSLQIIDLSYLPDSLHLRTAYDTTFARVHNIFIDEDNALLYACTITPSANGSLLPSKSMEVYSLSDPINPTLVYSGPSDIPEVHDCYVRDNIAYLNCGMDGLRVYDFTNPTNPILLQNITFYLDQGYNHQGWLSPDGSRYIFGDETNGKRLKNCTVDENHEITIKNYFGSNYENESVPHNIMLTNDFAYVAYYNEGLRIFDLRTPVPTEIAHYDTYPDESDFKQEGAWGMYSEFPSGRLLVSDRQYGLFLFDFRENIFINESVDEIVDIYPIPLSSESQLTVKLNVDNFKDFDICVYDLYGNIINRYSVEKRSYAELALELSAGIYFVQVQYTDYLDDRIYISKKIMIY
ncbi:MAG: choice-of-anchor B family protein [Crocinitomicaceae bacterium]|nr:choice-of-anchor B family protein [Crocinitomicaceae bacterium]